MLDREKLVRLQVLSKLLQQKREVPIKSVEKKIAFACQSGQRNFHQGIGLNQQNEDARCVLKLQVSYNDLNEHITWGNLQQGSLD